MGLTSFSGDMPVLKDVKIAKNYLKENELKVLSNLISGYFDFAEIQAMRNNMMYMRDYIQHLDRILASTGEEVLKNAGSISHKQAVEKAITEYRKYQAMTLSPVEEAYIETIKSIGKEAKNKAKGK